MTLKAIPKLADMVEQPERVADLPLKAVRSFRVELATLDKRLELRWDELLVESNGHAERAEGDKPLSVEEAAVRLGMKKATLYRRAKTDSAIRAMVVDSGIRRLLFSEEKIEAFLRRRTGR